MRSPSFSKCGQSFLMVSSAVRVTRFAGVWGRNTILGYLRVDFLSEKNGKSSLMSSISPVLSPVVWNCIYELDAVGFWGHYGVLGVSLRSPSSSRCGQDNQ